MMKPVKMKMDDLVLDEKMENLIAIGAATASNCIPCFEHIYEKAITSGITAAEIKRASDIAAKVKAGAHVALTNSVKDLLGDEDTHDWPCNERANSACCG